MRGFGEIAMEAISDQSAENKVQRRKDKKGMNLPHCERLL
jgi:hypothetical protein